jgi:hypothetical protein
MTERELLRHSIAVLAYRGGKPLRDVPADFPDHDTGGGNTPRTIVAHLADLMDWALTHLRGEPRWTGVDPRPWHEEVERFYASLASVDAFLASSEPIRCDTGRLLAGPIADALTHVGQLMMLRRMIGSPVYGENYFVAEIVTGRVGPDQAAPIRPF